MPRSLVDSLHVTALAALAIAQPLFDLLGRNPEFFAVRQVVPGNIVVLALALSLVPGLVYLPVALAAERWIPRCYRWLHPAVLGCLAFLILLPPMHRDLHLGPWAGIAAALGCVLLLGWVGRRFAVSRRFLHLLSPAILVLPGLFLFHSPVRHLLSPPETPQVEGAELSGDTPVVVVILDELPLSSLLRSDGSIDAGLFPGFAALTAQSTWYPNAFSVAEYTTQALPAMLTGRYPTPPKDQRTPSRDLEEWLGTPTAQDYPHSLFTALGGHYQMQVFESVTRLCPENLCPRTDNQSSVAARFKPLLRDLAIVYVHVLLPRDWSAALPPVDLGWTNFALGQRERLREDDAASFSAFIESLVPHAQPTLYLHHSTLPHNPWNYLPSGNRYGAVDTGAIDAKKRWSTPVQSRLAFQRHLLQTRFADALLGQVIARVKRQGFFDRALFVVTADHGASFQAGTSFREAEEGNATDIVNIPLFIKYPGQVSAAISAQPVLSIDLVPTIVRALGGAMPWPVDGSALQDKDGAEMSRVLVYDRQGKAKVVHPRDEDRDRSVIDKIHLFGQGDARGLFGHPYAELIDEPVSVLQQRAGTTGEVEIAGLAQITRPDARRNWLPALVTGRVHSADCRIECPRLALAVNDRIAAILHPQRIDPNSGHFAAVISDTHLQHAHNDLSLYHVHGCGDGQCLTPMSLSAVVE